MTTSNERELTGLEKRQITNVIASLVFSGFAVVVVSLASRRVSFLRNRLQSRQWRARLACAALMASYNLLMRMQPKEDEAAEPEATDSSEASESA